MKSKLHSILVSVAVVSVVAFACSSPKSSESTDADEWKEMDEFHMVMADVFHPLKDSGNLQPIRTQAEDLAASAATWADAKLPAKVDNDDVRKQLADLKAGTRELADQVKLQAADAVVGSKLTELHDQFHKLQEAWYHEEGHHQH
jgi:hypothetical protein